MDDVVALKRRVTACRGGSVYLYESDCESARSSKSCAADIYRRTPPGAVEQSKDADDEGKKETLQLHQDNVFPEQVMWSPNTKKQVTLEMGTMVGKRTPPSTPVRLMKKYETEAAIALPSPEKKGNKKNIALPPDDGNINFDNLMWGEKSKSTALRKGIVLSTRKDGTEVIKLEWGGLLYRLCRS